MKLRPALALLVLGLAVPAPELRAWDADSREAIVLAALRMSPAAEARVPTEYRDRILSAVREGDGTGSTSCFVRGAPGTAKDPAVQAAALASSILAGKAGDRPYKRANTYGRLLFFLTEVAVPQEVLENPCVDPETFLNKNVLFIRERRPLASLSADDLRRRGAEAAWADPGSSGLAASVRVAANFLADALLLLPVVGAADAKDEGPSLWVLNTIDDGRGGRRTSKISIGRGTVGNTGKTGDLYVVARGAQGTQLIGVSERLGLLVLEWAAKSQTSSVRALLVNNDALCATGIVLKHGVDSFPVPGSFAPWEARVVEFAGPPGIDPSQVRGVFKSFECSQAPANGGASTFRRVKTQAVHSPDLAAARESEAKMPKSSTGFGAPRELK